MKAKRNYNCYFISFRSTNPRQLWKHINILLHYPSLPALPSYDSLNLLSQLFAKFFSNKIHKLHTNLLLLINLTSASPHFLIHLLHLTSRHSLVLPCTDEDFKLLSQSPNTNCDPIYKSLLKQFSHILQSLTLSICLSKLASSLINSKAIPYIITLKNKSNLDKEYLSNYRPIFHLSLVQSLLEDI